MTAVLSNGTKLQVSTDAGVSYDDLYCEIVDFTGPGIQSEQIDVTTLCKTARQFIAGVRDYGEITVNGIFNPTDTTSSTFRTLAAAGTEALWRIIWNNAATTQWDFPGIVPNFTPSANQSDALKFSATVKLTDEITET